MNNLKTFFSRLSDKRSIELSFGSSPEGDWKVILVSTVTLTILTIAFSVYMFIKLDKKDIYLVENMEVKGAQTVDRALLSEAVIYYGKKAEEFDKTKGTRVQLVDPSF